MKLNQEELKHSLAGKFIGYQLYYYEEIDSTNDEAFRLGLTGAPEGTAVIAEKQNAGKGRLQRVWYSPAGSSIFTSIILRPQMEPAKAPQISLLAGVAAAEALDRYCPGRVKLKWPNDVLIDGKKVCGILSQMKIAVKGVDFIVLGIGINVNIRDNEFPKEIGRLATSLATEVGREIARQELIISLYENLAKWYKCLTQDGFGRIKERWLSIAPMIGEPVEVAFHEETVNGMAIGLDEDGSLILRTAKNEEFKVSAGDATIVKR